MKDFECEGMISIVAGPSGVGKTSLSYPLAKHLGVPLVEADDLFCAVEAMTTPGDQPWIHFWKLNPEATELPAEIILDRHLDVCRAMSPAIAAVMDNHLETETPIVLEGDYILPELVAQYDDRVRSIFLFEENVEELVRNFLKREPEKGEQRSRALVSGLFGDWLRKECERLGLSATPSKPWDTLLQRSLQVFHRL